MASKSMRYFLTKLGEAAWPIAEQVAAGKMRIGEGVVLAREAFLKPRTSVIQVMTEAMAPTFKRAASATGELGDRLLVRSIANPSGSSIFVNDVVEIRNPLAAPNGFSTLVRRVTASEGDELASDSGEEYTVPSGACWVENDNEAAAVADHPDSRVFGPVPYVSILSRAVYYLRTKTDHGPVRNSDAAMAEDEPVLDAELDVEELGTLGMK